ncbi:hypothetical protein PESHB5_20330 [Pediococcus parvulus]|nr:hypothetical protein PPA04_17790 [Pediococcus parvulus]GHC04996.1 hypothetical protein GCM10008912_05530 [Pediococcus parvulus]
MPDNLIDFLVSLGENNGVKKVIIGFKEKFITEWCVSNTEFPEKVKDVNYGEICKCCRVHGRITRNATKCGANYA